MNSPNSLPDNFSRLVHLRYLKIGSISARGLRIPSTVSKLSHLKLLDLESWEHSLPPPLKNYHEHYFPKDFSRLINLHHFPAAKEFHSNVPEVGKMKCLQELKKFHVKKDTFGYELAQLGQLEKLGGELSICGLKNASREEAIEAKLKDKSNLTKLRLVCGIDQDIFRTEVVSNENHSDALGDDILDSLQPHSKLRELSIVNLGGVAPSWLRSNNIHVTNLDTLHLDGVSWATLVPFGKIQYLRELKLRNIVGMRQFGPDFPGGTTDRGFRHLKEIMLEAMPDLVKWVGGDNSHLFSGLELLHCIGCPKLNELPSSSCSGSSAEETNTMWFPNLCYLNIEECPELSLALVLHTSKLTDFQVNRSVRYYKTSTLSICGYNGALAFKNLASLEEIRLNHVRHMSLKDLQPLRHSLQKLQVEYCGDTFFRGLDEDIIVFDSVKILALFDFSLTRRMLLNLLKCFPALYELSMSKILSEENHEELILQIPSSCSSLQNIQLDKCKNLILPVDDGVGLGNHLISLEKLNIKDCGKIFSQWYNMGKATQTTNPFPSSLRKLCILDESSMHSMSLISNLTVLTSLILGRCYNLTIDGFNPLITSNLKELTIYSCESVTADLLTEMARTKTRMPQIAFQLEHLGVDDTSAVLVAPICSFLSPTLLELTICHNDQVKSLSDGQEGALQLLASLKKKSFDWLGALQSLPEWLHQLSALTELTIFACPEIQSLPKNGLPSSLENLRVYFCSSVLEEEKKRFDKEKRRLDSDSDSD